MVRVADDEDLAVRGHHDNVRGGDRRPGDQYGRRRGPCSDVEVIFARGTFEPPGPGAVGSSPTPSRAAWAAARLRGQLPAS